MTIVQRFQALTQATGYLKEADVRAVFDELPPITPDKMIGSWNGGSFNTGHPIHEMLEKMRWAGKDFRSINDVDPIIILDDKGKRIWCSEYGHARLREVKFRGVVSTGMIFDKLPIVDSLRYVSDRQVMGAMDNKDLLEQGTYYFYLTRI